MGVCSEGVRRGEVRLVTVHEEMCEARENILKIAKIKKNCQLRYIPIYAAAFKNSHNSASRGGPTRPAGDHIAAHART